MIDVGTGTGVLAIALAKRTGKAVLATDIDPIAVRTTNENARDNGVATLIDSLEATGLDHPAIAARAPYDLVVANILAGPLTELAPGMGVITQPGGTAILSGILNTQAEWVIAAYEQAGFTLRDHLKRKDWTTLVLEKR
jgi:ribosomal protein L11 methyltransferase